MADTDPADDTEWTQDKITATLTFDESAAEDMISAFGWEVTNTGYIWDGDDVALSTHGQPVHINNLAGIVEYEGDPRPLSDDFVEVVDYVKYRHAVEQTDLEASDE